MVKFLALCIGALVICVSGCTARVAYEAVRVGERNHCNELPDTERERCVARTQDDFDVYQRKKAEAESASSSTGRSVRPDSLVRSID